MFPIDPTPYIQVYCLIVFIIPWLVIGVLSVRIHLRAFDLGIDSLSLEGLTRFKETWKDPLMDKLYEKACNLFLIVVIIYILGISLLAFTLYKLDEADLLINHSKGIYGSEELIQAPNQEMKADEK